MNPSRQEKIRAVYANFKTKLQDIVMRKKTLLGDYRKKMDEVKIKEIKDSLHI